MLERSSIKLLPEHLIDQIKAGEVVERPASLVKEIIENSLDAGAKHIELQIIDNGLELVALEDDGQGMHYDDLPYAFARHATSKIIDYADLFKLSSFGFRGEALASISSVSRLTCSSAKSDGEGGKIEIHGGQTMSHTAASGMKTGTSLYIRDLFYNTPARLKFIKSKTSEKNALKRIVDAFLLTARKTAFSIRWDDQDKKIFSACNDDQSFVRRLERVLLKRKDSGKAGSLLYESRREFEGHRLELHLSTQAFAGSNKQHFLFANNRLFNDKRLHQTIVRSLPSLWGNESGHYACFLTVPADQIDVNVHPNKTEVKFMREDIVFAMLKAALSDLDALSTPMNAGEPNTAKNAASSNWRRFENTNELAPANHATNTQEVVLPPRNEVLSSQLPIGYRWHPSLKNTIIDESALVRFACSFHQNETQKELVPLLINEPISHHDEALDLVRLQNLGFDVEWIDKNLLALRAISSWLRPLPYVELCRHAISHLQLSKAEIFREFTLTTHLSDSVLMRLSSQYSRDTLINERLMVELDAKHLARLFAR